MAKGLCSGCPRSFRTYGAGLVWKHTRGAHDADKKFIVEPCPGSDKPARRSASVPTLAPTPTLTLPPKPATPVGFRIEGKVEPIVFDPPIVIDSGPAKHAGDHRFVAQRRAYAKLGLPWPPAPLKKR